MRVPRIVVDNACEGSCVEMSAENYRHVVTVLRRDAGDELIVLDGIGGIFGGRIDAVDREASRARVSIGARRDAPVVAVPMTIAVGVPKGDALELAVRLSSEIGLSRLQPLITERTIVKPRGGSNKIERWRRIALESSKQCGRASPLEVADPTSLQDWLGGFETTSPEADPGLARRWVAVPGAEDVGESGLLDAVTTGRAAPRADDDPLVMLIGPEGGLSAAEVESALARRFRAVGFATPVLRTPTAVVYASALASLAAATRPTS